MGIRFGGLKARNGDVHSTEWQMEALDGTLSFLCPFLEFWLLGIRGHLTHIGECELLNSSLSVQMLICLSNTLTDISR